MKRGFPSMTALLAMIALAGYQNRDKIADMLGKLNTPGPDGKGGLGGLLEKLGLDTKSAGAGGILTGGLGELLDRFKQNGQGDKADSWVKTGPNQSCSHAELEKALGPDVIETLTQHTGLAKDELLSRLCRELPEAVDKYTPEGQLPAGVAEGRA
ncbi:MAG: YidB family protein [Xanthobacteraceae bacterium]